jgi:hypothetical protein
MKRFGIGFLLGAVLLSGYWAWPFVGLHDLATDLAARDSAGLDREVDFARLRHSLTAQIIQAYIKVDTRTAKLGAFGNAVASAIGASIADPLVAQIINPENLVALLNGGSITTEFGDVSLNAGSAPLTAKALPTAGFGAAWQAWLGAEYRLDQFSIAVPLDAEPSAQFRIRMQLLQWHWKLVGLDLPETLRARLAQELTKKLP